MVSYEHMSKEELLAIASYKGIHGASQLDKQALIRCLRRRRKSCGPKRSRSRSRSCSRKRKSPAKKSRSKSRSRSPKKYSTCKRCVGNTLDGKRCKNSASCKVGCDDLCRLHAQNYIKGVGCRPLGMGGVLEQIKSPMRSPLRHASMNKSPFAPVVGRVRGASYKHPINGAPVVPAPLIRSPSREASFLAKQMATRSPSREASFLAKAEAKKAHDMNMMMLGAQ